MQGAFTLRVEQKLIDKLDEERRAFAEREGFSASRSEFAVRLIRRALGGAVDLPDEVLGRLDALRGSKSRVDFVGDLVTTCWDSLRGSDGGKKGA